VVQEFLDHTTPSAPSKEASLLLLDVAATPPPAEEGNFAPEEYLRLERPAERKSEFFR